jgi:hypothetical protein
LIVPLDGVAARAVTLAIKPMTARAARHLGDRSTSKSPF